MKNKKVLFFGRYDETKSKLLFEVLKKKFRFVKAVWSKNQNQRFPKKVLEYKGDYIFCYRSYYILSDKLLKQYKYAINFHPGSPAYRGIGCLNFAVLNGEKKYGVTAHIINEKVDNGKIILTKNFSIKKKESLSSILRKTNILNFHLAKKIIGLIHDDENKILKLIKKNKIKWAKKIYYRNNLEKLYEIKLKYDKNKINKIIRATSYKNYHPYIMLGKKKIIIDKYL